MVRYYHFDKNGVLSEEKTLDKDDLGAVLMATGIMSKMVNWFINEFINQKMEQTYYHEL